MTWGLAKAPAKQPSPVLYSQGCRVENRGSLSLPSLRLDQNSW